LIALTIIYAFSTSVLTAASPSAVDHTKTHGMTLLSDAQFHVVDEGGSTRLECAFRCSAYTLFDYPVIWRKQQLSEWTQVNVMGSLNKPFVSTDRFEVTFSNVSSRYLFQLNIVGQSVHT